ncbi:hypothetical protein TNCV_1586131 [Trichonephila clavipes]|uniref:Uncharacterized protein n=1 Tax=Trichonephila clavipes TaxID=2585209 RepID=A0A8X6S9F3_TRICX|nr:hypothetical protein TNCV_1586131 [Trichonephila clavipes]
MLGRWNVVERQEHDQSSLKLRLLKSNVTPNVVCTLWRQLNDGTESIWKRSKQGHPKATKTNEDQYLFIVMNGNRSSITPQRFHELRIA